MALPTQIKFICCQRESFKSTNLNALYTLFLHKKTIKQTEQKLEKYYGDFSSSTKNIQRWFTLSVRLYQDKYLQTFVQLRSPHQKWSMKSTICCWTIGELRCANLKWLHAYQMGQLFQFCKTIWIFVFCMYEKAFRKMGAVFANN